MSLFYTTLGLSALMYSSFYRGYILPRADRWDPIAALLVTLSIGCATSMFVGALFISRVPDDSGRPHVAASAGDEVSVADERRPLVRRSHSQLRTALVKDIHGLALLRSPDFYLLFLILGSLSSIGLMCEYGTELGQPQNN